jgi:hypothetical protein
MNSARQDDKLGELFLELKKEDARRAPSFGQVWETASSRRRNTRRRDYFLRIAATAAMLLALGIVVAQILNQHSSHHPAPTLASPKISLRAGIQSSSLPWQSAVLISEWRAPTDFLLQSPGEQLLKWILRSGQPQIDLPDNTPVEKN